MRKLTALLICACIALSAAFAQTRQQALDEIARIEKVIAQTPEMLRQAWEAGRRQTETVIDTPHGKVTIKFNLAELIREMYTGDERDFKLKNRHGEMGYNNGYELRLNNGGSWKNEYPEGMRATIAHELGHYMMDKIKQTPLAPQGKYRTVEDVSEIDADAFAMRYIGKAEYIKQLKRESNSQDFIDAVIKRMEEIEREERENLARLRAIANAPDTASPPAAQPQNTRTARSYIDSGIVAYDKGDYDKAIADFSEAIRLDPKFTYAYDWRGFAYFDIHNYDKAIADFTEAIRLDPKNKTAYNNRTVAYNDKGDYDRAIADATQAIQLDPNFKEAYMNRALAYNGKSDYTRARADVNKALQLDPNHQGAKDLDAELKMNEQNQASQRQAQQQQVSEKNLIGVWKGSYFNLSGEVALILTVYKEGNKYMATFDFFNLPGRTNSGAGKYYMDVSYNKSSQKFYLKGTRWIEQPRNYIFADLEGTINGNVFSGFVSNIPGNRNFRLIKQ